MATRATQDSMGGWSGPRRSTWRDRVVIRFMLEFYRRKKFAFWAAVVPLLILAVCAVAPDLVAPYDPFEQNADDIYEKPSLAHPFGTDNVGSDVMSRVIHGAGVTLKIGVLSALAGTLLAVGLGTLSAFVGGWVDIAIQRLVDAFMAFPGLILLLLIISAFGQGEWTMIGAIALFLGIAPSRVIRGSVLSLREETYVAAARSVGASESRILIRHVLPNVVPIGLVLLTVGIGSAILIGASLDFLGLGLPPPNSTWGYTIGAIGRVSVLNAPWIGIFPGLALSLTVFAFNILGDALRDLLDPRMAGSEGVRE